MSDIATNIATLRMQITQTAERCNRNPQEIRLIAVSKTQPNAAIEVAMANGQIDFGENYSQELVQKSLTLKDQNLKWHFIGHLQRNKVNALLPHIHCLHSLDRLELAQFLDGKLKALQKKLPVLIEVKLSGDAHKTGLPVRSLMQFVRELNSMAHLQVEGLMMVATANAGNSLVRQEMRQLRELRDEINVQKLYQTPLTQLSMGMSHDYQIAIEEGATLLRIGSLIFGERI